MTFQMYCFIYFADRSRCHHCRRLSRSTRRVHKRNRQKSTEIRSRRVP